MDFGRAEFAAASLSEVARGLRGSDILRMGAEVRARRAAGHPVCNLTVGDFDPAQFPIPAELNDAITRALAAGQTNYPPADGLPELREAVAALYRDALGLDYPADGVLIGSGARPLLFSTFATLVDPGDTVVYAVPSWNNHHYVHLSSARGIELSVSAATNFFPCAEDFEPHLASARLITLNSPLNPTGTMIDPEVLRGICVRIVEENRRRASRGQKALWLLYDQVYWQLAFGATAHVTPPALVPEVAPFTVLLDAASKSYAATGLRVGWALMPPAVRHRMADIIGHVGAWAPRAEQVAMAQLLRDRATLARYRATMNAGIKQRLERLASGLRELRAAGAPVEVIDPQGAIYLSMRVNAPARSNEAIRQHLLEHAGLAVIPFQAFGEKGDTGWFRLSVGAVSLAEIESALPRLRTALETLAAG
ncbi:MAG TPA: aminotransferase class I/II-fold pyridoxal phosphate-dependent enzyme [Polyangia bacterium]